MGKRQHFFHQRHSAKVSRGPVVRRTDRYKGFSSGSKHARVTDGIDKSQDFLGFKNLLFAIFFVFNNIFASFLCISFSVMAPPTKC